MSLVAYGSSDESESDENNDEVSTNPINISENESVGKNDLSGSNFNENIVNKDGNVESKLFTKLPHPKKSFSIPDNTFKLLNKKPQPVKIILPSLSEIKKSTDEDDVKKKKPSSKGSGLFALLPAPKNSTSLVPNSVKKVQHTKNVPSKPLVQRQIKKEPPSADLNSSVKTLNDDDDDISLDKPESFFFTSTDDVQPDPIDPIELPGLIPKNNILDSLSIGAHSNADGYANNSGSSVLALDQANEISETQLQFDNNIDAGDLDQEAIEKLCGSRARKRKGEIPEEIIDINVDSMVGDAYMWLSKDLTKEQEHGYFKKPKNLSVVERRKHQITYLASQAKEKEMELRNQWANSRMTRKQTQSKYGF